MKEQFSRTALLLGKESITSLSNKKVAIFGIGGVGGYVCEALVRSGIGHFDLIDNDTVCLSNINRQIIATHKTIGRYKTEVMKERMLDINPDADITIHECFFLPETSNQFDFSEYDYIVDAVDTVTAKIELIIKAKENNVPIISAMGAGNKLDPCRFQVADIYKTSMCPLAKVMRRELKKRGIDKLKVVYSDEPPLTPLSDEIFESDTSDNTVSNITKADNTNSDITIKCNVNASNKESVGRRSTPGSTAFVPSVAGLIIASEVIKDLTK